MRIYFLSCILIITTSFVPINFIRESNPYANCQTVIDSATVFLQTSESAIEFKPTIKDRERHLRLNKWLTGLPFKSLTCLLESESISLKALGFVYATVMHSDSLLLNYSHLLSDTTRVRNIYADGVKGPKMKLSSMLSLSIRQARRIKEDLARQKEIEQYVERFILKYSAFPETYKSLAFPLFIVSTDKVGLSGFRIRHEFELKNNKMEQVKVLNEFVFDRKLIINVIEKDSSRYISSYPPRLDYWLTEFGRDLSGKDSLDLHIR